MTDPILAAFVVLILCLFGVAALPDRIRGPTRHACTALAAIGALLAAAAILIGEPSTNLDLPVGLPGQVFRLDLDATSAGLLLLLFLAGGSVAAFAAETRPRQSSSPPSFGAVPTMLGGLALAALAADGFVLAAGLSIAALAVWASMTAGRSRTVALGALLGGAAGLFLAIELLSPPTATSATAPMESVHASAAFLCGLAGAGALAGIAPFHRWLLPAAKDAPTPVVALLSGAVSPIALGLLAALMLEPGGPIPPAWWAWIPLVLGSLTVLVSGWQGATAIELDFACACAAQRLAGLATMDLGLGLLARSADLPGATAVALSAMMLVLATLTVCAPLSILSASALQAGAGSRRIDRLGGLLHFMPGTSAALMAGLVSMAAVPPAAGFAGFYLSIQAVLSAPRTPGLAPSLLTAGTMAILALGAALGLAGTVRLIGVTCLGRPRTPRSAAATEPARAVRLALFAMAGAAILLGLFPGLALALFGAPALGQLTGIEGTRAGVLHLGAASGSADYAPLPIAALLALCGGGAAWLWRRATPSAEAVPIWQDGFPATTSWMPFGDPMTQSSGAGFVPPAPELPARLRPTLHARWLPRLRIGLRRAPLALLLVFAVMLAIVACGGMA